MSSDDLSYKERSEQIMKEQAIAIALLGVPDFRRRAGLPRKSYGDAESLTLIAAVAGISRQQARNICLKAILKLRHALHNHHELH